MTTRQDRRACLDRRSSILARLSRTLMGTRSILRSRKSRSGARHIHTSRLDPAFLGQLLAYSQPTPQLLATKHVLSRRVDAWQGRAQLLLKRGWFAQECLMDEFLSGNVRGDLKKELSSALAIHLPPKQIEDAFASLCHFAKLYNSSRPHSSTWCLSHQVFSSEEFCVDCT